MTSEALQKSSEASAVLPPVVPETKHPEPSFSIKTQLGRWTRFVLASNPFYILSAVMVLWSMDLLSLDSKIFSSEMPQLYFNVSAFQIYELLLVMTAIFLAGRGIWYDSGLLVGLENMFIAVPFILVSQVLLSESPAAMVLCAAGCVLAVARIGALKGYIKGIHMPAQLLVAGGVLLIANLAMPMLMRHLHKDVTFAIWYDRSISLRLLEWMLLAPLCVAPGLLLPKSKNSAPASESKTFFFQSCFPILALLLWAAGTMAHFYSIGYVYGFNWQVSYLIPAVWMAAWVLWNRAEDFDFVASGARVAFERVLALAPVGVLGWAIFEGDWQTCSILAVINALVYGGLALRWRSGRELQLGLISMTLAIASMPLQWVSAAGIRPDRFNVFAGGVAVYLSIRAILSRNAKMGVLGAIVVPCLIGGVLPWHRIQTPFALVQLGLIFFLLHSLRWDDSKEAGAGKARALAAVFWMGNSILWLATDAATGSGTIISALAVLAVYSMAGKIFGNWGSLILPIAACAVLSLKPIFWAAKLGFTVVDLAGRIPTGLVILGAGFGMFAIGTLVALTRGHWTEKRVRSGN